MLSTKRQELLKSNKDRIRGLKYVNGGAVVRAEIDTKNTNGHGCLYQYPDGDICAASACITDDERRAILDDGDNSCSFGMLSTSIDIVDGSEMQEITNFQVLHDALFNGDANERQIDNFRMACEDMLLHGKIVRVSQDNISFPGSVCDYKFEKDGDVWERVSA